MNIKTALYSFSSNVNDLKSPFFFLFFLCFVLCGSPFDFPGAEAKKQTSARGRIIRMLFETLRTNKAIIERTHWMGLNGDHQRLIFTGVSEFVCLFIYSSFSFTAGKAGK